MCLGLLTVVAVFALPGHMLFSTYFPDAWSDPVNHAAIVSAAIEEMRQGRFPIASDQMHPGITYPYFLFGNSGFYIVAAFLSFLLNATPNTGMFILVAAACAAGAFSMFHLARQGGVGSLVSIALALLYLSGPYMSLNLLHRAAYPEYVIWQLTPLFFCLVRWSITSTNSRWSLVGGIVGLCLPIYFHKLVGPHVDLAFALLLAPLALRNPASVFRFAVVGACAGLLSVPAWLPMVRGLTGDVVIGVASGPMPDVVNNSLLNLFSPIPQHSLSDRFNDDQPDRFFTIQAGLVPLAGFVSGLALVVLRPRSVRTLPVYVLLAVFVIEVMLVLNSFDIWKLMPSTLAYIQLAYRLTGLVAFSGFLLLIESWPQLSDLRLVPRFLNPFPSVRPGPGRFAPTLGQLGLGLFFGLVALSYAAYWRLPSYTAKLASDIRPADLSDTSHFFESGQLNGAVSSDRSLVVPPVPVLVRPLLRNALVRAQAPAYMFDRRSSAERKSEPLTVRVYGFARQNRSGDFTQLAEARDRAVANRAVDAREAPFTYLASTAPPSAVQGAGWQPLPGVSWFEKLLFHFDFVEAGELEVAIPADPVVEAIAIECSRTRSATRVGLTTSEGPRLCLSGITLVAADNNRDILTPGAFEPGRVSRLPMAGLRVDASTSEAGFYKLPIYGYPFLEIRDDRGYRLPTYLADGQPVIWHDGAASDYTASIDFQVETLSVAAGLALLAFALVVPLSIGRRSLFGAAVARGLPNVVRARVGSASSDGAGTSA